MESLYTFYLRLKRFLVDTLLREGLNSFSLDCFFFTDRDSVTHISISNQTKLNELECYFNKLTSLDLSNSKVLRKLNCTSNKFQINLVKICRTALPQITSSTFAFQSRKGSQIYEIIDCE